MKRVMAIFLATAAAVTMTAACSDRGPERTATAMEAFAEAQASVEAARVALDAELVSVMPAGPLLTDCSDPIDGGPAGRVYWQAYYETADTVRPLPTLDDLVSRMLSSGWSIRTDRRNAPGDPGVVFARNGVAEPRVSIRGRPDIRYDVDATTSCVWPDGVRP